MTDMARRTGPQTASKTPSLCGQRPEWVRTTYKQRRARMAAAVLETAMMIKVIPHKTREADINLPSGRICTSRLAGNWATMRPAQKVVVFELSARARSAVEEGGTHS